MAPEQLPVAAIRTGRARERQRWELAIYATNPGPGQVVADIGCGKGRFSFELAEMVGPDGLVYCRDTASYRIDEVQKRVEAEGVTNMNVAVSERGDVGIPAASVGVANNLLRP